jgi:uncharacterized protein (TIGR03067 family)
MRILALTVVTIGLVVQTAFGRAEPIGLKEVPAAVMESARMAASGTQIWLFAFRGQATDGKPAYRLVGKNQKGEVVAFTAREDGTVIDVRTEVALRNVPQVVQDALSASYHGFKPEHVMAVGANDREILGYRYEGKTSDGKAQAIVVSADGRSVVIEGEAPPDVKPGEQLSEQLKALQGTWIVMDGEQDGEKLTEKTGKGGKLVIKGTDFEFRTASGQVLAWGKLKLTPTADPREFDVDNPIFAPLLGIYDLDGDGLEVCWKKGWLVQRPKGFVEAGIRRPGQDNRFDLEKGKEVREAFCVYLSLKRAEEGK